MELHTDIVGNTHVAARFTNGSISGKRVYLEISDNRNFISLGMPHKRWVKLHAALAALHTDTDV